MGKLIGGELYAYSHVMSSDDDQPIVMDIYAGFTGDDELTIAVDCRYYDDHRYDCSTAAIVNKDDAEAMARRHKVEYFQFPRFISRCMAEWREIINPDFRQIADCFKEITECLLDEGCRFRITRTHGKDHSTCI